MYFTRIKFYSNSNLPKLNNLDNNLTVGVSVNKETQVNGPLGHEIPKYPCLDQHPQGKLWSTSVTLSGKDITEQDHNGFALHNASNLY